MQEDVKVAPSILAANFLKLGEELASISNADYVHFDVMDGHFVPNISFGIEMFQQVHRGTDLPIDVHLMVSDPEYEAVRYAKAGADIVTFHMEATSHAHRVLQLIRAEGAKAGVVLCPATPISALDAIIEHVDMVLLMSVNPGLGGQAFIDTTYRKLRQLRALCAECGVDPLIEVDGGIVEGNVDEVCACGANVVVAGSSVFHTNEHAMAVDRLREIGRQGLARRL